MFESEAGPFQRQLKNLKNVVGYPASCDVDWAILWRECEPHFEDKSSFIPYVVGQASAVCDAIAAKLEDESSPWTQQLLEKIEPRQAMKLDVQVCSRRTALEDVN